MKKKENHNFIGLPAGSTDSGLNFWEREFFFNSQREGYERQKEQGDDTIEEEEEVEIASSNLKMRKAAMWDQVAPEFIYGEIELMKVLQKWGKKRIKKGRKFNLIVPIHKKESQVNLPLIDLFLGTKGDNLPE